MPTIRLPHPWPFPVIINGGKAMRVVPPPAPKPKLTPIEDAPF